MTITSTKDKKVVKEQWVDILAGAMNKFFNAKVYSTQWTDRKKLTWTFYGWNISLYGIGSSLTETRAPVGLAEGTVAAAQAFEMCHNQVRSNRL